MYNLTNLSPKLTWSLDLETRRNADAEEIHKKCGDYDIKPAGNLKDPVKQAADVAAKLAKVDEKDGLFWGTGAVVSYALTNLDSVMKSDNKEDYEVRSMCGLDERTLLLSLCEALDNGVAIVIGKNLKNFDIPFLIGRLITHKIKVPRVLLNSYNFIQIEDLMKASSMGIQDCSLGKMLICAGLEDKLMSGSEVQGLVDAAIMAKSDGDMDAFKANMIKIKEYNIDDTIKVAIIFKIVLGGFDA